MLTSSNSLRILVWKVVADPKLSLQPLYLPDQVKKLDQASAHMPPGAYTTFRTYFGDRGLHLSDHINRLAESAALSSKTITLDECLIRCAIRKGIALFRQQMLEKSNTDEDSTEADLRIRLTLGLESVPLDLFLAIEMLPTLPPETYVNGVPVQTIELQRTLPEAKLTNFIELSKDVRQNLLPGVNEVVMINEAGFLTEGISSNFFAVLGGDIRTAGAGVLSGITRTLVLEQAVELGIPVRFEPVHKDEIIRLDEAFITSSSRGVLPICQIDHHQIGDGRPGPITQKLIQAFERLIKDQTEPI